MSILSILNELAATSKRTEKEAILKREIDNADLQQVIYQALNPYINYYQKKIPAYTAGKCVPGITLIEAINELEKLSNRTVTGNAAINTLGWILQNCSVDNAKVIERIIERDLKCGVDTKTVNKIWSGLIPTFDVCLAHKDITGIKYPAMAQTKMDGARCHLYYDGLTGATAFSRSGKEFQLHGALNEAAKFWMRRGETFDGELLFYKDGKPLDRKTSNGLANKANKGTLTKEEAEGVRFIVWDIVDFTGKIPYEKRFQTLKNIFHRTKTIDQARIDLVKWSIVNSEEDAWDFYNSQIASGEEGAILKNLDLKWEPKRVKGMGKMKAEEEADLVVVGFKWGTGKYENELGSLECETEDGLLSVNVSGMTEEVRFQFSHPEKWIGNIITVKYNQIIEDKRTGKKSLFLPRYIETRFDKKVANKLEELK